MGRFYQSDTDYFSVVQPHCADAIIQRKELDQGIKSTIFWFNVITGVSLALIIVISASVIDKLFNEQALIPVLMWLALSFPLASLGTAQQTLRERESHFKKVASIEISAAAIALTAALVMAYQGFSGHQRHLPF